MWLMTRAGEDEDGIDLVIAQMSGRPVDLRSLSQLRDIAFARNAPPPRTLVNEIEAAEGGWTSLPSIDIWGARAAALIPDSLVMDNNGALASTGSTTRTELASTVAWHEHTAAFATLECGADYTVYLEPDPADRERDMSITSRRAPEWERLWAGWQPDGPDYRVLDWHLYLGDATTTIHGQTRFVRVRGRLRAILELRHLPAGVSGFFVGKVLKVLGPVGGVLTRDRGWDRRVEAAERRRPDIARRYPRLDAGLELSDRHDTVAVIVHGTHSSAMPAAELLDDARALRYPTYRYEHDTFVGLAENARELDELINHCFPVEDGVGRRIVLIAHSRGGLVARWARHRLTRSSTARVVDVLTLGTPHQGTPVVSDGLERIVRLIGVVETARALLRMDTLVDASGVAIEDPVTLAGAYLYQGAGLPPGIRAMAPKSDTLLALDEMDRAGDYTALGGDCRLAGTPAGFLAGLAVGLFDEPNDFIVATASSTAGPRSDVLDCSHSAYFADPRALTAIKQI